ncbi:hypothetical protein BJV77DRAFT_973130 [Russula vinacea]|nr:hypothetical protein BJV77DRAFT_973130 [Russula vinacea]
MFTRLSSSLSHSRSYSTGPNKAIIDLLSRCLKEEDSSPSRNGYKVRSYQVAIAAINDHKKPILSGQEAIKLRGIGLGIANRIDFFLQGKEYDEGLDKEARARWIFQERTATNLVNAGAASVSDLHLPKYASLLTPTQKVGVRMVTTCKTSISAEAEEIVAFIRDHISTTSSRRESTELPGVSILFFHPQHIHVPAPPPPSAAVVGSGKSPVRTRGRQRVPFLQVISLVAQRRASPLLQDVVRPLQAAGLLAATIASSACKWRGMAILPLRTSGDADVNSNGMRRGAWEKIGDRIRDIRATRGKYVRLDLSLAPPKSRGAAQIVLTGDEEFVRIARLAAARQGMFLNEYGLWRWHSSEEVSSEFQSNDDADSDDADHAADADPDAEAEAEADKKRRRPNGYWELRILEELDLGSIAPQRRNFRFVTGQKRASARAGTLDFSLAMDDVKGPRRRKGNGAHSGEDS